MSRVMMPDTHVNMWSGFLRTIAALALLLIVTSPLRSFAEELPPHGPLPRTVVPLHYSLELTIVPQSEQFSGHAEISVELLKATSRIWLHGRELEVQTAQVVDAETGGSVAATYEQVAPDGIAVLRLDRALPAGKYKLAITYSARFNKDIGGMFKVEEAGRHYVFTQLEPTDARKVFPSFDEPGFKAPFDIAVTAPDDAVVVTSTKQIRSERQPGGLTRRTFATSRPLSTYLVSFAVGDLDVIEWAPVPASRVRSSHLPLRGIAAKGKGEQLKYALQNTAPLLVELEGYFGVPYPYDKLDLIAAPIYAGAMENAAAILYGEQYLLLGENASQAQQHSYAYTHAHELAHQWIGNLVTPTWWDDLWLKESFATLMGNRAAGAWQPHAHFDRAILRMGLRAMVADSRASARAIWQPVPTAAHIADAYGPITYEKGNAVLAMLEQFVGKDAFQRSVQLHLRQFIDRSASTGDYLASLKKATGSAHAGAAFSSFLRQPGVPLVSVDWHCRDGSLEVELQQSRYAPLASRLATDKRWVLPVCIAYDGADERRVQCVTMDKGRHTLSVEVATCPAAVMPNAHGSGYYRFTLPKAQRLALVQQFDELDSHEALAFAENLAAEFHAGRLSVEEYLEAVERIVSHGTADVAIAPIPTLTTILRHLVPEHQKTVAQRFLRDLYRSHSLDTLIGQPPDPANAVRTAELRGRLVPFLALELHDPGLRSRLATLAGAYVGFGDDRRLHPEAIDANLIASALAVAAQERGKPFVDELLRLLYESTDFVFRRHAVSALAHITDPRLANEVRALLLSSQLRDNEALELFVEQASVEQNLQESWTWSKAHLLQFARRVPGFRRGKVSTIASSFCDEDKLQEARALLVPLARELDSESQTLPDTIEQIEHCVSLTARHGADAARFFGQLTSNDSSVVDQAVADLDRPGQPGCAVGVYRDGRVVHASGHGLADLERRIPITPQTVFNIASVSKQMTAFAIFLLEARGQLSLDDSARKYVPELGSFAEKVTVRHLVHHTAGLRDYAAILSMQGRRSEDPVTVDEIRRIIFRQRAPNHPPGRIFEYSNTGYALLALIVERITGQSFSAFSDAEIFRPLDMRHTSIVTSYPANIANLAHGYKEADQGYALDESFWEGRGSGQVHTTILDLQRWDENLHNGAVGGPRVSHRMREVGTLESGQRMTYAGGLVVGAHRGLATVGHNGSWAGYRSEFLRFPDQRLSIALLCNRADADTGPRVKAIADTYLGELMQPEAVPSFAHELSSLDGVSDPVRMPQGYYRDTDRGRYVRFWIENGQPKLETANVEFKLTQMEGGVFASQSLRGLYLVFVAPGAANSARIVLSNMGDQPVALEFLEQTRPQALRAFVGKYRSEEAGVEYEVVQRDGFLELVTVSEQIELQAGRDGEFFAPDNGVAIKFQRSRGRSQRFLLSMFQLRNIAFTPVPE